MKRMLFVLTALVLFVVAVQAQDAANTQLKSLAAKNAETKFNADMQKLDADYQTKAAAIKLAYVDNLKTALKNLAKKDDADPDEIAKLSAKIKEVQAMVVQGPGASEMHPKQISGKWTVLNFKGTPFLIREYKTDGTVKQYSMDGIVNEFTGKWTQTEHEVIIRFSNGSWERFMVSLDGKRMSGGNSDGGYLTEEKRDH